MASVGLEARRGLGRFTIGQSLHLHSDYGFARIAVLKAWSQEKANRCRLAFLLPKRSPTITISLLLSIESMNAPVESKQNARSVKEQLHEMFPVFQSALPLAIGIHRTVFARLPDIPVPIVRAAISLHTSSTPYLKSISAAKERYDLDGAVAGEVTEEQRALATAQLKERFAKSAKRAREQQAEKEMQNKLVKLAERFNVRSGA